MPLNISSRKSDLAKLQSFLVGKALSNVQPNLKVNYRFKESLGDINLTDPLWKIPQKGVFTEDFNHDLLNGVTDMVVHSWKDLPVEKKTGLSVVATLPRADQRDILLVKKKHLDNIFQKKSIHLYSSSPRRFYNIEPFLKSHFPYGLNQVHFESVRGNIPTRLNKLFLASEIDGLIVAKAALDRLLLTEVEELQPTRKLIQELLINLNWMVLPLSENPNAAAQGAIAIEIKDGSTEALQLLEKINHPETFQSADQERALLAGYGGGCHQKIGVSVLPHRHGQVLFLKGLTDQGEVLNQKKLSHPAQEKLFKKFSKAQLWSEAHQTNTYFDRQIVQPQLPQKAHFFIAKADCVSEELKTQLKGAVLWTAGTATWKKLASQGLWVHGTQDGLGENEPRHLEAFVDASVLWHKLSHSQAALMGTGDDRFDDQTVVCYELKRNEQKFDFSGKDCFFWSSASLFLAALNEHPEIADKIHCCGPGNSAELIEKALNQKLGLKNSLWTRLFIFLNQVQWSDYVTQ